MSRQQLDTVRERLAVEGVARRGARHWEYDAGRVAAAYAGVTKARVDSPRFDVEPPAGSSTGGATLEQAEAAAVAAGLRADIPTAELPSAGDSEKRLRYFRAAVQEAKALALQGELLARSEVEKREAVLCHGIKDAVLSIPTRCADTLAAITGAELNPQQVHAIWQALEEDLRRVLTMAAEGEWERLRELSAQASQTEVERMFKGLGL
ncbi:hypothetical protein [Cyanobium sp. LEGE 06113]|uniref:hypothetical protein n=1 Tax=Cyanobium sp. LEGE 06113 TaxID=1297573 RepID=UPI00187F316A|nr:hypothetical protein [Cyanobium sp. LEGE 06113]MBE9155175.1 hypothetical protein [Cyanobium sp. LEGE 06113]